MRWPPCKEVPVEYKPYRKSSRSDAGQDCVEVADAVDGSAVLVRDSKDPSGPVLNFGSVSWSAFVDAVKSGRLLA